MSAPPGQKQDPPGVENRGGLKKQTRLAVAQDLGGSVALVNSPHGGQHASKDAGYWSARVQAVERGPGWREGAGGCAAQRRAARAPRPPYLVYLSGIKVPNHHPDGC